MCRFIQCNFTFIFTTYKICIHLPNGARMDNFIVLMGLLYIGGAGLMFESLVRRNISKAFLKCWLWIFFCAPHIKSEIARIRK
ncbi:hypothetical protein XSR1_100097 [Xenorhabdus szentirmaii DSM 16338]|uniref:Uncharacterized protein n=1 Tax=Xenorhabdus szentirmaii DSM 16338 TaxID=1427518 RepID=W1IRE7_9GAMM|nr:hypothetical protein XSR1_100097 [Xenorhabdus szentirmaii DSM 16338]